MRPLARLFLILFFLLALFGCRREVGDTKGLLAGARAVQIQGVTHPERLTDGLAPKEGGAWNSNRATIFSSRHAFVTFDLGEQRPIEAVAILADNNDTYQLAGSVDGETFTPLWLAPRVREPGMRFRTKAHLGGTARYLKLSPGAGDASLSVAELSVFSESGVTLPPELKRVQESDTGLSLRSALLLCSLLLVIAAVFAVPGGTWSTQLALFLLAVAGLIYAGQAALQALPIGKQEVSLIRALSAFVALCVVARQAFSPKQYPPHKPLHLAILGVLSLVSVLAFYNLGTHQFYDHKNSEPSHVHNYDMRVYFPVAKYFKELKYDGLYLGSIAAYAEEHGGIEHPAIQRAELRDLRDHRMRRVSEIEPQVRAVKSRFSEARWAEFKQDMRYFWETMGSGGYLGSMADHGGNATPVWLSVAHVMFRHQKAGNDVLLAAAVLDPLLLLIFFVCVLRSFGAATAFVSLIVFGANDFYMFGSNWAGATLRNDWMVYLGLGACALKTQRFRTGGALLAMSALIRAFPAVALLALGVPVLHAVLTDYHKEQKWPGAREFYRRHRWFFETALGATLCVVISVAASSLIMGGDSWPLWVKKISSFTASPHVNHISLLTVVAGSEGRQAEVLAQRSVVFYALAALYFFLAAWVGARKKPHQAALLGIMMMPVFMYPANYYMHFIFLLPLLVGEVSSLKGRYGREAAGKAWMLLLGICAAQYFTVKETDLANHFYNASVILMVGLLGVLIVLLPRDREGRLDLDSLPFFDK